MSSLISWLRKNPQPHSLAVRTEDDELKPVKLLPGNARNKWKSAEETIHAMRAVSVECLDKDGEVIRAWKLREIDGPNELAAEDPDDKRMRLALKDRDQATAQMLDRYGDRLNEAFERGAAAANTGQDSLVALVETLTGHLSLAITNLHNVSVNLANFIVKAGGGEDIQQGNPANDAAMAQLLAGMATRFLSNGGPAQGGGPAEKPNGKAGKA